MEVYRTETHRIKKNHPLYNLLNELTFKSKNLYNLTLYFQRQYYFQHHKFLSYQQSINSLKQTEAFKDLPCTLSQQVVKQTTEACRAFQQATKSYYNTPEKFKAKPKLPKYKDKTKGRFPITFTTYACRIKDNKVHFHKILNNFTLSTKLTQLVQVQILPKHQEFWFNITGTKQIQPPSSNLKWIASIDLGIDNFSAITVWNNTTKPLILNGKGLKSYNKNFNKILSNLKSEAKTKHNKYTTHRIQRLYQKRNNHIKTWMHQASRITINHLLKNQVSTLVIGHNMNWKQNSPLSKVTNQTFIQIPYSQYINYLTYKAEEVGIKVHIVNEAYTSGTSFLDNEPPIKTYYDKTRRKHRGLFISNNSIKINADINASYQIAKKVFNNLAIDTTQLTNHELHNKIQPQIINVA